MNIEKSIRSTETLCNKIVKLINDHYRKTPISGPEFNGALFAISGALMEMAYENHCCMLIEESIDKVNTMFTGYLDIQKEIMVGHMTGKRSEVIERLKQETVSQKLKH